MRLPQVLLTPGPGRRILALNRLPTGILQASVPIDQPAEELTLIEHLEELRVRILRCIAVFSVMVCIGYAVAPWPLDWLTKPMVNAYPPKPPDSVLQLVVQPDGTLKVADPASLANLGPHMAVEIRAEGAEKPLAHWEPERPAALLYLKPTDPLFIRVKAAVVLGVLFSIPVIIYEIWAFLAPGLVARERRFALPVIVAGSLLFPLGAGFAWFLLDVTLSFLASYSSENAAPMNDMNAYLSFVLFMMLAFGAVFELPLLVVLATRAGLVTVGWLAKRRKIIFVFLLVLAAFITPSGDPFTLMALAGPLYLLFEVALLVSWLMDRSSGSVGGTTMDDDDSEASTP